MKDVQKEFLVSHICSTGVSSSQNVTSHDSEEVESSLDANNTDDAMQNSNNATSYESGRTGVKDRVDQSSQAPSRFDDDLPSNSSAGVTTSCHTITTNDSEDLSQREIKASKDFSCVDLTVIIVMSMRKSDDSYYRI